MARVGLYLAMCTLSWIVPFTAAISPVHAQSDGVGAISREYAIKAAFLYHFGSYVQWPAEVFPTGDAPFVIGVLGPDSFGEILDEIARTKRIGGRPIVARRFVSMAVYLPCQVLFVSPSVSPDEKAAAFQRAEEGHVLLVGEEPGFAERGGTIGFFIEENKVRFEINVEAARRQGLKISSKLLSLARIVGG